MLDDFADAIIRDHMTRTERRILRCDRVEVCVNMNDGRSTRPALYRDGICVGHTNRATIDRMVGIGLLDYSGPERVEHSDIAYAYWWPEADAQRIARMSP